MNQRRVCRVELRTKEKAKVGEAKGKMNQQRNRIIITPKRRGEGTGQKPKRKMTI